MVQFDAEKYKRTTQEQWESVAERWNSWGSVIDRWLGPATELLMDMAELKLGDHVLHVAGGSGQEALLSARRVGDAGKVTTVDFSDRLTALARINLEKAGVASAEALLMDGEKLKLPTAGFDAVLSRVGLIFFPDQLGAVQEQRRVLKAGGRVGAIVYASADECRFFSDSVAIVRRHAEIPDPLPGQPGAFSLGAPGVIDQLFEAAGLKDVRTVKVQAPLILTDSLDCLRFQQESFGALHQMLAGLEATRQKTAWDDVAENLKSFEKNGRFEGPCALVLAVGRK